MYVIYVTEQVDKVALEVFAGGGRSVATVATDKRGVDPVSAVMSIGVSSGQATMDIRLWNMGCGWIAHVEQQQQQQLEKREEVTDTR